MTERPAKEAWAQVTARVYLDNIQIVYPVDIHLPGNYAKAIRLQLNALDLKFGNSIFSI